MNGIGLENQKKNYLLIERVYFYKKKIYILQL